MDEAHGLGKRLYAHARACDSAKVCLKHGVDAIYHVSYIDDEGMLSVSVLVVFCHLVSIESGMWFFVKLLV